MFCAGSLFITHHWSRCSFLGTVGGFLGRSRVVCILTLISFHNSKGPFFSDVMETACFLKAWLLMWSFIYFAFFEAAHIRKKKQVKIHFLKLKGTYIGEKTVTSLGGGDNSSKEGVVTIGRDHLAHSLTLKHIVFEYFPKRINRDWSVYVTILNLGIPIILPYFYFWVCFIIYIFVQ